MIKKILFGTILFLDVNTIMLDENITIFMDNTLTSDNHSTSTNDYMTRISLLTDGEELLK